MLDWVSKEEAQAVYDTVEKMSEAVVDALDLLDTHSLEWKELKQIVSLLSSYGLLSMNGTTHHRSLPAFLGYVEDIMNSATDEKKLAHVKELELFYLLRK